MCAAAIPEDEQDDLSCRRGTGRALLSFPSKVALSDGRYDCVLEDLSLGGARIRAARDIEIGRELWLQFDQFEVFGTVSWAANGEYGVQFEERLPKSVIMQMQGHSVDLADYEAYQGRIAAKAHVIGEAPVFRSPLMRLLDVVGPIDRKSFGPCPECAAGLPCEAHCGHKQYRRAQYLRVAFYLGLAALVGALSGIGSVFID